jgi:hypothetical protein
MAGHNQLWSHHQYFTSPTPNLLKTSPAMRKTSYAATFAAVLIIFVIVGLPTPFSCISLIQGFPEFIICTSPGLVRPENVLTTKYKPDILYLKAHR